MRSGSWETAVETGLCGGAVTPGLIGCGDSIGVDRSAMSTSASLDSGVVWQPAKIAIGHSSHARPILCLESTIPLPIMITFGLSPDSWIPSKGGCCE